jgi:hypothetical protein
MAPSRPHAPLTLWVCQSTSCCFGRNRRRVARNPPAASRCRCRGAGGVPTMPEPTARDGRARSCDATTPAAWRCQARLARSQWKAPPARRAARSVHRPGRHRVRELRDRVDNPEPDRYPDGVTSCRELVGSSGALHLGSVAVAFKHQVRDAPNVDLGKADI